MSRRTDTTVDLTFLVGVCPVCGREVLVDEKTGNIMHHNAPGVFPLYPKLPRSCVGTGCRPPKTWRRG